MGNHGFEFTMDRSDEEKYRSKEVLGSNRFDLQKESSGRTGKGEEGPEYLAAHHPPRFMCGPTREQEFAVTGTVYTT